MRKPQIPIMVALCLLSTFNLFGQSSFDNELKSQTSKLIKSESAQNVMAWFGSTAFQNFLLAAVIFSGIYFSVMITLFVLINKEVISLKENSLVALLMEDWMTKKEEEKQPEPVLNPPSETTLIFEQMPTIEYPNWELLSVEMNGNSRLN